MNETGQSGVPRGQNSRRKLIFGAAAALGAAVVYSFNAQGADESGVSHTAGAIHQEPIFQANRKRVYDALTEAQQFDKIVRLSAAMQSMAIGSKLAAISREAGGAFAIFGGYISGRQIELVTGERIVQAWRTQTWNPGDYSIARFELVEQGSGTKIIFDHQGFPNGTAEHLAAGWKANYWEPLQKYLSM